MSSIFLLAVVFLFGSAPFAQAETCTWTAASSTNMSSSSNWSGCTLSADDDLLFNGAVTTTNAIWDSGLTQVASTTVSSSYTGVITIGAAAATTTGNFTQSAGTVSSTGTGLFKIGGDLLVTSPAVFKGNSFGNLEMYGTNKTVGGGGNLIFYDLTINGTLTLNGTVTTTNRLTINASQSLDAATSTINLTKASGAPFVNNGTFIASTSTVNYAGGTSATTLATTYYNLTINTAATMNTNFNVTNDLSVSSGKSLTMGALNVTFGGNITNSGTISHGSGGIITLNGTSKNLGGSGATQFDILVIDGTITLAGNVTSSNTITINSNKSLNAATHTITLTKASGTPLVIDGTFTASTSTVVYSGATSANIAAATYYNLTVNTTGTLAGNVTINNVLTIDSSKSLDGATAAIVLSGSGTSFVNNGTFTASTSAFSYTSTGSVTTTAASYYTLTLGSGTYALAGNTTSTNSFTNGGTFTIGSDYYLYAPGTFDNNGTITEGGAIKHPITSSKLTNSSSTEVSSYTAGTDSVYVSVTDDDGNLSTSTIDTITGTVVSESTNSDSETITLTETGADTGIFRSAALAISGGVNSASVNSGAFNVNGNGTLSLTFTDSKDSSDTGSDTASFTASAYSAPSSGGGGRARVYNTNLFNSATVSVSSAVDGAILTSSDIILKFSASNATHVAISENKDFGGVSWLPYAAEKSFALSAGDGLKQIYVKFRAERGEESSVYTIAVTVAIGKIVIAPSVIGKFPGILVVADGESPYKFTRFLQVRSTGAEVRALQQKLKDLGYFTYPTITGYFGPITRVAVIKFQKDNNLKPYPGWVGPATRRALNNL